MTEAVKYNTGSSFGRGNFVKYSHEASILKKSSSVAGLSLLVAAVAEDSSPFADGGRASEVAINMINTLFESDLFLNLEDSGRNPAIEKGIKDLFVNINNMVYSRNTEEKSNVRLSLTLIFMIEEKLYAGHVGTGKILKFSEGGPVQMTQDHSWLSQAMKQRGLKVDEALQSAPGMMIKLPIIGIEETVDFQFVMDTLEPGGRVALFSSGISELIPDQEVQVIFNSAVTLQGSCERLVAISRERGLKENASIAAFSVESTGKTRSVSKIVKEEKKSFFSTLINVGMYIALTILAIVFALGGLYIGYEYAKKALMTPKIPPAEPAQTQALSNPAVSGEGKCFVVKEGGSLELNFIRLNRQELDPHQEKYEVTDDLNNLEIMPVIKDSDYTLDVKINSKNSYRIFEGNSRNTVEIQSDAVNIYLTKGAVATLKPDEGQGVMSLEISGLGSPVILNFDRQNMILKLTQDSF